MDEFFEFNESVYDDRKYILIIYDIVDNKRRLKLSKFLLGYGDRVQKSSFEALISKNKLQNLLVSLPRFVDKTEDSIRVYEIANKDRISSFGINKESFTEDIIFL